MDASVGSPALWAGFLAFVAAMLALDLGVFNRKAHEVSPREAAGWSAVWIGLAGVFGLLVWRWFGPQTGLEYATGYVVEKALSVDNIFVFVVVFASFGIPAAYRHRVLFWGIFGALVLRAAFILAGGALLHRFHWMLYVFGALLLFTGVKLLVRREETKDPSEGAIVRLVRRVFPVSGRLDGGFLVRDGGRVAATPLLLALVAIEAADVVFAVDSIPAVFAVTTDPFIVFTSNIFAILGLRSLYFLLAGVIERFHHLKIGLALILVFVGAKMVLADVWKLPVAASLGVIAALLAGSIAASIAFPRPVRREPQESVR